MERVEIHHIGPFVLGKTLGTGTTGKVKLAFHKETGARVAVKIIDKEFLATRQTVLKKVEREIAAMKVLNHPSILRLYDVYETEKHLFLVLEQIEGGELFDYLIKRGRLDAAEALIIFQQIIIGIDYCHSFLICHRDLKPENLLMDENKRIKIADFGMASLMKKGNLLATSCGSPHYASPEVVQGIKYNGTSADIWSCGVILYALLTGKLPFDDDNIRRLLTKVKSGIFSMPPFLHKDVKELLWKMLTVDPTKRFTIAQIKENSWFNSNRSVIPIQMGILGVDIDEPIDLSSLNDEVIRTMHSLGWGSDVEIRILLGEEDAQYNTHKAFYNLLLARMLRTQESTKTGATITRTHSAPMADFNSLRTSTPSAPMSPMATSPSINAPRPIANITQIPVVSNLSLIANTMTPPASPMINRPTSTSMSSAAGELLVQPYPDRLKKRSNSNTTSALNISAASNRLQRMKIETSNSTPPGSPIIGTSPKRSWFSTFFANNEKGIQNSNTRAERSYSMTSNKSMDHVINCLTKTFKKYHIIWDNEDKYTIIARHRSLSSPSSLKFRVSVRPVADEVDDGPATVLHMDYLTGESYDFDNIWQLIEPDLVEYL
ncbi:hypothetical protein PROFUN_05886 [Planoprotostelium fungivorum]|uniref:non-specific serine/threonine protein kinase n=1 Tax=Planoprotostelium fungivorum TaxID=1890364 RepID=A0A2P6NKQ6_9EUKA|nr:hypothetical protein PROFUN_05886 [Planoprotostelium fungivorum]